MERKEVSDFKRKILKIKKKSYLFICATKYCESRAELEIYGVYTFGSSWQKR